MRRVGSLLAAILCFLLASEGPAAAHGAGGIEATNFVSTLDGFQPALPGVRIRLVDTASRLELRNDGPEVVVLGVGGEPYLRVGPEGAFENRRSPTAARNRESSHGPPSPADPALGPSGPTEREALGPSGPPEREGQGPSGTAEREAQAPAEPPEWRKLSGEPVVRWHDHRTHWNEARNPPDVARRPGERHLVIPRWEVTLLRGSERAVAFGSVTWVPGPSPAPWFGLMAVAGLGVAALGLLRRWGRPLALATMVLLTVDVVHAGAAAFAASGSFGTKLAELASGSFYGFVGWVLAAVAIRLLRQGKVDGLYAGVFAGLSIAVFGGLLDLATLSRHVTPFALPVGVARLCVALAAGAGFGLAGACLLVIRRTPDARRILGNPDEVDDLPHRDRQPAAVGAGLDPPT